MTFCSLAHLVREINIRYGLHVFIIIIIVIVIVVVVVVVVVVIIIIITFLLHTALDPFKHWSLQNHGIRSKSLKHARKAVSDIYHTLTRL